MSYYDEPDTTLRVCEVCHECECDIYEGDTYYLVGGFPYCEECISDARREAEGGE